MNKVTFDPKKHTIYDSLIIIKHAESNFQANEKHDIERKSAVFRSFILHQLRY